MFKRAAADYDRRHDGSRCGTHHQFETLGVVENIDSTSRQLKDALESGKAYWETHRRFEREGKLTHSSETCPERLQGKMVKIWQPETGWKDVTAPQAFAPFGHAATR